MAKEKSTQISNVDFVRQMQKLIKDDYTSVLEDGEVSAEYGSTIDTGSYALNALLSGSIYGGLADNKVLALAGETSVGKSFFTLAIEKAFMDTFPGSFTLKYDTESATNKEMMKSRGIDPKRVIVSEPESVEKFRTHCVKFVDEYMKAPTRPRCMVSLDSLGNLSTNKEVTDITDGTDKRDMTRSGLIRGAFRVLRLRLAKAKIPMIVTAHVYDVIGAYIPTKEMGGGCLVKGTEIQTPVGNKKIEEIKIGDLVSTLEGNKNVTNTFIFNNKEVFEVTFEDKSTVKCSGDHKFLCENKWVSVYEMLDSNEDFHVETV